MQFCGTVSCVSVQNCTLCFIAVFYSSVANLSTILSFFTDTCCSCFFQCFTERKRNWTWALEFSAGKELKYCHPPLNIFLIKSLHYSMKLCLEQLRIFRTVHTPNYLSNSGQCHVYCEWKVSAEQLPRAEESGLTLKLFWRTLPFSNYFVWWALLNYLYTVNNQNLYWG